MHPLQDFRFQQSAMSADKQFMEHRCGTRIALHITVELETTAGSTLAAMRNASVSGAYLETMRKPALLSRVTLSRRLVNPCVQIEAGVVRVDNKGVALEWLDPGLRTMAELMALCAPAPPSGYPPGPSSPRLPRS